MYIDDRPIYGVNKLYFPLILRALYFEPFLQPLLQTLIRNIYFLIEENAKQTKKWKIERDLNISGEGVI